MQKKVLILYKYLPQWRMDFFDKLRKSLKESDIALELIYGKLKNADSKKNDEVVSDWGIFVDNKFITIGTKELIWQPVTKYLKDVDLVIVEQANKLVINYFLMVFRKLFKFKLAFWGHGINRQASSSSPLNKFKKHYLNQSDWWFSYTQGVTQYLTNNGVSSQKITTVNNAIDTLKLIQEYDNISEERCTEIRSQLKIDNGLVGIFCGGMYKEKRLEFLVDVVIKIKEKIPDFSMIFIGAGPEDYFIKNADREFPFINYLGPLFFNDRIPFFKISDVFLMPGLVGLAILDAFALQTPIMTTNYPFHSPEIEYLVHNQNGIITNNNKEEYVNEIVSLLENSDKLKLLKTNGLRSAKEYTSEKMVSNFVDGIKKAIIDKEN